MAILGVYDGHNAGAAAITEPDGVIIAAVEEERFSRIKNHDARRVDVPGPTESIRWCLAQAAASGEKVTAISIGLLEPEMLQQRALDQFSHAIKSGQPQRLTRASQLGISVAEMMEMPRQTQSGRVQKILATLEAAGLHTISMQKSYVEHHKCHSAAYLLTSLPNGIIVTLDGKGDCLSGSISIGVDHNIKLIAAISSDDSLGHFYSAVTVACGLRPQRDEGKLTALSAKGQVNQRLYRHFAQLVGFDGAAGMPWSLLNQGIIQGPYPDRVASFHNDLIKKLIVGVAIEDVARTVQSLIEYIVVRVIEYYQRATGESAVVLSGGLFANVSLTRRVAEIPSVSELHVHPGMTDSGIALGAAAWTYTEKHNKRPQALRSMSLGPSYAQQQAVQAFEDQGYTKSRMPSTPEFQLALALQSNVVVARFVGGCEYGPRALGFRSILAPATSLTILAELNRRLGRSQIMPFAPVVLAEWADDLFEGTEKARVPLASMATSVSCTSIARQLLPGIVHIDGSARPQIVDPQVDSRMAELLTEYYRLTQLPGLVNTSFNMHDEPIVCSPNDAALCARKARIRVVQVEDQVFNL